MIEKKDYALMSYEALRKFKYEIANLIKEKQEQEKAIKDNDNETNAEYAKNILKPGNKVVFRYKEGAAEGVVQKLSAKTFTVAFSDNGEDKVLVRAYHLFVKLIDELNSAA